MASEATALPAWLYPKNFVPWTGFEPVTHCLEGSCSIRLSYQGIKKIPACCIPEPQNVKQITYEVD